MSGLVAIAATMRIAAVTAMTGAIGSTAIVMPIIAGVPVVSVTMFGILIAMPVSVIKNRSQHDPCGQGNNHVIVVIGLRRLDHQPQY
jgi:hypothetical protein